MDYAKPEVPFHFPKEVRDGQRRAARAQARSEAPGEAWGAEAAQAGKTGEVMRESGPHEKTCGVPTSRRGPDRKHLVRALAFYLGGSFLAILALNASPSRR